MKLTIGTQMYPWTQWYSRQGKSLDDHLDEAMAQAAEAGLQAWEHSLPDPAGFDRLCRVAQKHGLAMPSAYANSRLHDGGWRQSADEVVSNATHAAQHGLEYVVTNPEPIRWGGPEDKNDEQLRTQAGAMRYLAARLAEVGVVLCYHTHDPEMRASAREVHHMMVATRGRGGEPSVMFCFDAHWIFRGAGNSNVALHDIVELYGDRIATLHLRQSRGGVWSETLGDGDLDYGPLIAKLREHHFRGPAIIETAFEEGTPTGLSMAESHRRSAAWIRERFV